jgi:Predicted membrane protein
MNTDSLLALLGPVDLAALLLVALSWYALGWRIEAMRSAKPSVTVLVSQYRREWMRQFVTRMPRMYDASVLATLRQSTNWLASTTLLALGGVLALIGNPEQLRGVAADLSLEAGTARAFETRLLLAVLFLSHAFLKFLWSNRLFGYTAIIMSTVPNEASDPLAYPRARQAAEINIRAAFNFNRGLRATYFALASLAWLLGPWGLIAATLMVSWLIWSREFASHSRAVLLDPPPEG